MYCSEIDFLFLFVNSNIISQEDIYLITLLDNAENLRSAGEGSAVKRGWQSELEKLLKYCCLNVPKTLFLLITFLVTTCITMSSHYMHV